MLGGDGLVTEDWKKEHGRYGSMLAIIVTSVTEPTDFACLNLAVSSNFSGVNKVQ